jgi:hypothetical protein
VRVLAVIASEAKQSIVPRSLKHGLLRFARNDAEGSRYITVILRGCEALSSSTAVIARLDRAIQYAAAFRFCHWRLWNTGSPACAGDDTEQAE